MLWQLGCETGAIFSHLLTPSSDQCSISLPPTFPAFQCSDLTRPPKESWNKKIVYEEPSTSEPQTSSFPGGPKVATILRRTSSPKMRAPPSLAPPRSQEIQKNLQYYGMKPTAPTSLHPSGRNSAGPTRRTTTRGAASSADIYNIRNHSLRKVIVPCHGASSSPSSEPLISLLQKIRAAIWSSILPCDRASVLLFPFLRGCPLVTRRKQRRRHSGVHQEIIQCLVIFAKSPLGYPSIRASC